MTVFENNYMDVELLDTEKCIIVVWKKETEKFDVESFKRNFLDYKREVLLEYKPRKIIHDLTDFLYVVDVTNQSWVDEMINKPAVENGLKDIGFVVSPELITQLSVELTMDESNKPIQIRYFSDMDSAKQWILNI